MTAIHNGHRRTGVATSQLPAAPEAERAALGSILIDPDSRDVVMQYVHADDFYIEDHRQIFGAMVALAAEGVPADYVLIDDYLRKHGHPEATSIMGELMGATGSYLNAAQYAKDVASYATNRRLIHAAGEIAAIAYSAVDGAISLDYAEGLIADLRNGFQAAVDRYFPILTDLEVEAFTPPRGIVGDILYEDSLAILYGAAGRWKSFLALSWALCIGADLPWMGRPVKSGDVVYIAAEGGRGIGKRITAWKRRHGVTGQTRVHVLPVAVQLLDDAQVQRLIRSIQQLVGVPVLIVIDTLSRSMAGGDENAAKDGSKAIGAADALRVAFPGCTVLLVAHPGKNEQLGVRGWSGYFAAADTVMRVSSEETKPRLDVGETIMLTSEKPKDAEPFADIALTTVQESWVSNDGADASSLVIVSSERPARRLPPMPAKRQLVLDTIRATGSIHPSELERQLVKTKAMAESTLYGALTALRLGEFITLNTDGSYDVALADSDKLRLNSDRS